MKSAQASVSTALRLEAIRVGDKGLIEVPSRYRRVHKLSKGSQMVAMEVGGALVLLPTDRALEHLSQRIQKALAQRGVTADRALKNLTKVRRQLYRELYGEG